MYMSVWGQRLIVAGLLVGLIVLGVYALQWQGAIDGLFGPPEDEVAVRLYFADDFAECLLVETRSVVLPAGGNGTESLPATMRAALDALGEGPTSPNLWPTIPEGSRVLDLSLEDGVAVVNYSEELRANHGGGSAGEILTVASIAGTLSEFPEVDAVQILIDGVVAETLVGHLSLLEPVGIYPEALAAGRICWDGIQ